MVRLVAALVLLGASPLTHAESGEGEVLPVDAVAPAPGTPDEAPEGEVIPLEALPPDPVATSVAPEAAPEVAPPPPSAASARAVGPGGWVFGTADYTALPDRWVASGGLGFEARIDRLALRWRYSLGGTSEGGLYLHAPAGLAFAIAFANEAGELTDGLATVEAILILSVLLPEGFEYRVPVGRHFEAGPYLSPLQSDVVLNVDGARPPAEVYVSGAAGGVLRWNLSGFSSVSLRVGGTLLYGPVVLGTELGLAVSIPDLLRPAVLTGG